MAAVEPIQADLEFFAEERARAQEILVGPCPCDGCDDLRRWQCSQNAACRVFAGWVHTGKIKPGDRIPSREIWHRVFRGRDEDEDIRQRIE
jgi:hypothetical protein